jgi:hypothetical protein|tara:strand:+ start:356 stop:595 length:240 start_codon:yes stop_codon:yes gene_type:complete
MKELSKDIRKELLHILTGQSDICYGLWNEAMTLSKQIQHLEDKIEHYEMRGECQQVIPKWEAQLAAFEFMKEAIEKALI